MEADAPNGARAPSADAADIRRRREAAPGPTASRPRRGARYAVAAVAAAGLLTGLAAVSRAGQDPDPAKSPQVVLTTPVTRTCNYAALVPGDLVGSATCSLATTYTGVMAAYVSLTVAIRSKTGPGGVPLYDGTNNSGLTLTVSDGRNSYSVPTGSGTTGSGTTGGSCPSGFRCWTSAYDLAGWYSNNTPNVTFTKGNAVTFTVTPRFPKSVGNSYQGGSATLTLTVQAVQAPSNPLPPSCGTSTIGKPCPATGTFSWS